MGCVTPGSQSPHAKCQRSEDQGREFGGSGEAAGDTGKMLAWVHLHGHPDPRFMNMQMVELLGWEHLRGVH